MIPPTSSFDEYLDAVRKAYRALIAGSLYPASDHSAIPITGGIYVFYEQNCPIYVGRTRNLRRRLWQHSHPNSSHYSASFAFLMARKKAALPNEPKMTRQETANHLDSLFSLCRQRVGYMHVRWVSEDDPIIQSLLEVYAAVTLRTVDHYNSFRTT